MTKFLVLYNSPIPAAEMMAAATPEEAKSGMDAWIAWAQEAGDAVVDLGVPLSAGKEIAGAGSVSPSDSKASGYSVLQAKSLDDAVALLKDHPHLHMSDGGSIEILEFLDMPRM